MISHKSLINDSLLDKSTMKKNLKARFIKESFAENYTVEQGSQFSKTWTFRNDGIEIWPADTKFAYTNGDKFGTLEKTLG